MIRTVIFITGKKGGMTFYMNDYISKYTKSIQTKVYKKNKLKYQKPKINKNEDHGI